MATKIEISVYEDLHKEHLNGMSLKELSIKYNMRLATLYYGFARNNMKVIPCSNQSLQRTFVNNNYFENVNSEIKSYLLGWIMSDGYISKRAAEKYSNRSPRFGIKLSSKDIEIINLFRKELSPDRKINKETVIKNGISFESSRLEIPSIKLVDDLLNLGVTFNKTGKKVIPKINPIYMNHFIRGFFDGDGSVSISKRNKISIYICCVNRDFLQNLKDYFDLIHIQCAIYEEKRPGMDVFRLNFSGDGRIKFYHYLYDNANYLLQRKFDKYSQYANTVLNREINKSLSV